MTNRQRAKRDQRELIQGIIRDREECVRKIHAQDNRSQLKTGASENARLTHASDEAGLSLSEASAPAFARRKRAQLDPQPARPKVVLGRS